MHIFKYIALKVSTLAEVTGSEFHKYMVESDMSDEKHALGCKYMYLKWCPCVLDVIGCR